MTIIINAKEGRLGLLPPRGAPAHSGGLPGCPVQPGLRPAPGAVLLPRLVSLDFRPECASLAFPRADDFHLQVVSEVNRYFGYCQMPRFVYFIFTKRKEGKIMSHYWQPYSFHRKY